MNPHIIDAAGWLPAIIFPIATLIQLIALLRTNNLQGISPTTWTMFGIANISVYIYTEKYLAVQTIVGFLGTALLDFMIAAMAIKGRAAEKT
ncbi:MAG TPA: hypothetical protein VE170_00725 [Candidatus Limnocylindria bacterium]|nr:hypothetical protein [Candidatus Limnocylindria bacterium]